MFLHESHLPQLLRPEDYYAPEQHEEEVERLFMPGWHCVGTRSELPEEGSFFTTELLGRPIIVRRSDNEVRAFLNVCAHRFSMLTDEPCGQMGTLKCRYHGWEYDSDGNTRKIPDARSFRPLQKGQLGLTKLKCETVGQLVFISLNPAAVPLREYLADGYQLCEEIFPESSRLVLATRRDNHANWKVSIENSLEGYHLAEVHRDTFRVWPEAEDCQHQLHGRDHSSLRVQHQADSHLTRLGKRVLRFAGADDELGYYQFHCYPNLVFAKFGFFSWMEAAYPTTPSDSYDTWRFFSNCGDQSRLRGKIVSQATRLWGRRWFKQVITEDEQVFPSIQQGLMAPEHPGSGLVSVREERVFHFQQYVIDKTQPSQGKATSESTEMGRASCS